MSSDDDQLLAEVRRFAALFELVMGTELSAARAEIRADKTDAAILDLTADEWVAAGELQKAVQNQVGTKKRAVGIHIADLVRRRFLEKQGSGPRVSYRSTEVV